MQATTALATRGRHYPRATTPASAAFAQMQPAYKHRAHSWLPLQAAWSLAGATSVVHGHLARRRPHLRVPLAVDGCCSSCGSLGRRRLPLVAWSWAITLASGPGRMRPPLQVA
ncbi:hypothetical protein B296_00050538 [Ensete ventricosum]|uniref:Uncharacterized protein n=1 Tax=Ensete ventricosum TaxID=4639 RepID=A0A426WXZ7_ENSVE|nr:hypothetical protein B296_00050538 [Ensete ventricosum]